MKRRFLAPTGTPEERKSNKIWPGFWNDATGYLTRYGLGYHTGADLNLNVPRFDADAHSRIYAIGPGVVTYAQRWPNPSAWGVIIVINHGIVDNKPCFSRYAHVESSQVEVGQHVDEWTWLANIGNADGLFAYHLHFDISPTDHLGKYPGDWPGLNKALVEENYTDPYKWLQTEHEVEGEDMPDNLVIKAANGLPLLDELPFTAGTPVVAEERAVIGTTSYRKVDIGGRVGWMLEADAGGTYLTTPTPIIEMYVNSDPFINVRSQPTTNSTIISTIPRNTKVRVQDTGILANGYHWVKLVDQAGNLAKELLRPNP